MVRWRGWDAMIRYGVIFFMLEKLGAVVGVFQPPHLRRYARRDAVAIPGYAQCLQLSLFSGGKAGHGISRLHHRTQGSGGVAHHIGALNLSAEDRFKVYESNALRVYPRLDWALKAKGK
jgi:hypothetical protein